MCDGYQLPKVVQEASKEVYKLVYDEKTLKVKSQESIMAAAIFIGCRKAKVARSFKEIWALTNVPRKEIGKVFKIVNKLIQEKNATNPNISYLNQDNIQTTQTSAEDLIRRFCSHLGLNTQITNTSEYIAKRCKEIGVLAGRSPTTIAATVIYLSSLLFGIDLPPSKISEKTGVSDGTIKTSYKFIYEEKDKLIDDYLTKTCKIKFDKVSKNHFNFP